MKFLLHIPLISGRPVIGYYICTGEDPYRDVELPSKSNTFYQITVAVCVVLHLITSIRIFLYKREDQVMPMDNAAMQQHLCTKALEKESLVSFATIGCYLVSGIAFGFLGFIFTTTEPKDFNQFPNCLIVYWIQLINAPAVILLLLILAYLRNKLIRKVMFRESKEYCSNLIQSLKC